MSVADLPTQLIAALKACANEAAGAEAPLVSVTMEFLHDEPAVAVTASIARKTRTLAFVTAEARGSEAIVATASSIHKIRS